MPDRSRCSTASALPPRIFRRFVTYTAGYRAPTFSMRLICSPITPIPATCSACSCPPAPRTDNSPGKHELFTYDTTSLVRLPFRLQRSGSALQSAVRVHQMCTNAPCGLRAGAAHDRFQYVTMFFERSLEPVRFEHLGAAEARHAVPQGERLLGDIGVVRGAIDGFMEGEIERGIGVDIASLDEGGRAFMQTGEPNALERMHAITCQADAKCFHLGRHFEHIGQTIDRKFGDDRTAPRPNQNGRASGRERVC